MMGLLRALSAERIKLRSTLAFWLCLLAPLLATGLGMLMAWSLAIEIQHIHSAVPIWNAVTKSILGIWTKFILPLFITLEAALLAALEHDGDHWKHLLALPLPRSTHYLSKWLTLVILLFLASLVLLVFSTLASLALTSQQPDFHWGHIPPWHASVAPLWVIATASILLLSLQCLIALHWRNFTIAIGIGITGTLIALMLPGDSLTTALFPWAIPAVASHTKDPFAGLAIGNALLGGILVAALGSWWFGHREYA